MSDMFMCTKLGAAVLLAAGTGMMIASESSAQVSPHAKSFTGADFRRDTTQPVAVSKTIHRNLAAAQGGIAGPCPNPDNDCCSASPTGTPGCSDPDCCNIICGCDAFCCSTVWDAYCAGSGYVPGCGAALLCEQCAFSCPKGETPPPNDECENATDGGTLGFGGSANYTGDLDCAGPDCPLFTLGEGNAWITFTLTEASNSVSLSYCGSVNNSGGPIGDAWLNLARECPCATFTAAGQFAFSCPDGNVEITWPDLPAGQYWYPVLHEEAFGANGNYNITVTVSEGVPVCPNPDHDCVTTGTPGCSDDACCDTVCAVDAFCCATAWDGICVSEAQQLCAFEPPANDACADRLSVSEVCLLGFSTVGATTDGPSHGACVDVAGDGSVNQDIWYNYTASCTGDATVALCGSGFDTKLAVYNGCSCSVSDANLIGCNDDDASCGGNGLQSSLTFPVTAGSCYKIRIGGFGTAVGNGVLTINNSGTPCGGGSSCTGDVTGVGGGAPDGVVDVNDLLAVINNWGACDN